MSNPYAHLHENEEIGSAIQNLFDRLTQYERSTGREYLVVLLPRHSDGIPVCNFGGAPIAPLEAVCNVSQFPHADRLCFAVPPFHKDKEIAEAIAAVIERLSRYERSTGRECLFILFPRDPDGIPVCNLGGRPLSPLHAVLLAPELPHAGHNRTGVAER